MKNLDNYTAKSSQYFKKTGNADIHIDKSVRELLDNHLEDRQELEKLIRVYLTYKTFIYLKPVLSEAPTRPKAELVDNVVNYIPKAINELLLVEGYSESAEIIYQSTDYPTIHSDVVKLARKELDTWYKSYEKGKNTKPDPKGNARLVKLYKAYLKDKVNSPRSPLTVKGTVEFDENRGVAVFSPHDQSKVLELSIVYKRKVRILSETDNGSYSSKDFGGSVSTTTLKDLKDTVAKFSLAQTENREFWLGVSKLISDSI